MSVKSFLTKLAVGAGITAGVYGLYTHFFKTDAPQSPTEFKTMADKDLLKFVRETALSTDSEKLTKITQLVESEDPKARPTIIKLLEERRTGLSNYKAALSEACARVNSGRMVGLSERETRKWKEDFCTGSPETADILLAKNEESLSIVRQLTEKKPSASAAVTGAQTEPAIRTTDITSTKPVSATAAPPETTAPDKTTTTAPAAPAAPLPLLSGAEDSRVSKFNKFLTDKRSLDKRALTAVESLNLRMGAYSDVAASSGVNSPKAQAERKRFLAQKQVFSALEQDFKKFGAEACPFARALQKDKKLPSQMDAGVVSFAVTSFCDDPKDSAKDAGNYSGKEIDDAAFMISCVNGGPCLPPASAASPLNTGRAPN